MLPLPPQTPPPRGLWPLLKPAEPLAAPHSPLPSASLSRDGLGTELCLQVQVLRDLVLHPATAAATHHSDARQGQLHLRAAPRTPGAGSQQRAPNPGVLSWSAWTPGQAQLPLGRAHSGAPDAKWEVLYKKFRGARRPRGAPTLGFTDPRAQEPSQ